MENSTQSLCRQTLCAGLCHRSQAATTLALALGSAANFSLANVVAVLRAGGAQPGQVTRLTWYVTDREAYRSARGPIGVAYRELFGRHFPAMSVVLVPGLLEERAKVEIEATAVVPDGEE